MTSHTELQKRSPSTLLIECLLAAIGSALLILLVWNTTTVIFETNDDTSIAKTLMGYYDGDPIAYHAFINGVLGRVLSGMSELLPNVSWFTWFHIASLFISTMCMLWCIIRLSCEAGLHLGAGSILGLSFCGAMMLLPMGRLQFSTTAAALATGATALQILLGGMGPWKLSRAICLNGASTVLLLLSFCLRRDSFYAGFIFFVSAMVWQTCLVAGKDRKRLLRSATMAIATLFVFACAVGLALLYDQHLVQGLNLEEYERWNTARALYMDYGHIPYSQNPQLYQRINWPEPLYIMVRSWFFMDDRVTTGAFRTLNQALADAQITNHLGINFGEILNKSYLFFANDVRAFYNFIILNVLFVTAFLCAFIKRKRDWLTLGFASIAYLSVFTLAAYLQWKGRINYRAVFSFFLPAALILVIMLLKSFPFASMNRSKLVQAAVFATLTAFLGLASVHAVDMLNDPMTLQGYQWGMANTAMLEKYAVDHPDTIVVYDLSLSGDFDVFPMSIDGRHPSNLFFWGGSTMHDAAFKHRLAQRGLNELNSDLLLNGKAVYATLSSDLSNSFENYMRDKYGNEIEKVTEQVGYITIISFLTKS